MFGHLIVIFCVLSLVFASPTGPSFWEILFGLESVPSKPVDIIIIGAGVSGLSGARHILEKSKVPVRVKILEARDRIGGRIHTNHDFGVEMGAGWIHGTNLANPIYELAVKHEIPTLYVGGDEAYIGGQYLIKLLDGEGKTIDPVLRLRSFALMEELWIRIEQHQEKKRSLLLKEIKSVTKGLSNPERRRAIGKYLKADGDSICHVFEREMAKMNLTADDRKLLNWHFEISFGGDDGADPCDLGIAGYLQYSLDFRGDDSVFPQGYDSIPNILAEGLDIELNQKVVKISYDTTDGISRVYTETGDEPYKAEYVLVTVPLGYLKQESLLEFDPPLPDWKMESIRRIGMGVLDRVALKFEEPFWPLDQYTFGYVSDTKGEWPMIVNQYVVTKRPILEFMVGGPAAIDLIENRTAEEIQQHLMKVLKKLFGASGNVPDAPIDMVFSKWAQDPYTFGSYSHIPPGVTDSERLYLAKSIDDVLFFAGEATEVSFGMTVVGAYKSGHREAKNILEHIHRRKQNDDYDD